MAKGWGSHANIMLTLSICPLCLSCRHYQYVHYSSDADIINMCIMRLTVSHTECHSHSVTHTVSRTPCHATSVTQSITHTVSHTASHTRCHTQRHTHTVSHTVSHTASHTHSVTHTVSHTAKQTCALCVMCLTAQTHTHTRILRHVCLIHICARHTHDIPHW